jgi:hypothetical protein
MMKTAAFRCPIKDWGLQDATQPQQTPEVHVEALKELALPAAAIFLLALGVYAYTLAPTILWGDPTKLARFVHFGQPRYLGGGVHGLHTQLGMVFAYLLPEAWPLAYKTNFMSAVWASLSLPIIYAVVRHLVGATLPAIGATACIGLSHMFWWVATLTESYSLLVFTFAGSLWIFMQWTARGNDWWLLALLGSLLIGFLNHYLTLLFVPVYAVFAVYHARRRRRILGIYLVLASIGGGLLATDPGVTVFNALVETTYVCLTRFSNYSKLPKELLLFFLYLSYQYPAAVFFGLFGMRTARHPLTPLVLSLIVIDVVFASFYGKARQLHQLLPAFVLFGYFIAAGFASVAEKMTSKKFVMLLSAAALLQPAGYFVVTRSASHLFHVNLVSESTFPYRDANIYYLWPSKRGNYIPYEFAKNAFSAMAPGAVILADFNIFEPLRYLQCVEGVRPDVRVKCTDDFSYQPEEIIWQDLCRYIDDQLANDQPVYMAAYESFNFFTIDKATIPFRGRLDAAYLIQPCGNIFQIVERK